MSLLDELVNLSLFFSLLQVRTISLLSLKITPEVSGTGNLFTMFSGSCSLFIFFFLHVIDLESRALPPQTHKT